MEFVDKEQLITKSSTAKISKTHTHVFSKIVSRGGFWKLFFFSPCGITRSLKKNYMELDNLGFVTREVVHQGRDGVVLGWVKPLRSNVLFAQLPKDTRVGSVTETCPSRQRFHTWIRRNGL